MKLNRLPKYNIYRVEGAIESTYFKCYQKHSGNARRTDQPLSPNQCLNRIGLSALCIKHNLFRCARLLEHLNRMGVVIDSSVLSKIDE